MLILRDTPKAPRQNPELNDGIEALDRKLLLCGGDTEVAFQQLTTEEQEFIAEQLLRCTQGPGITGLLYFLCNYFFIKTKEAGFKPVYPLWDSQMLLLDAIDKKWRAEQAVWFIILKARQLGISTVVEAILLYLTIFNKNWNSLLVADEPTQSEYLFEMARNGLESLPWFMKPERRYDVKGHHMIFDREDEQKRALRPGLKSALMVESANQRSGAGYGKTISALHASEVPKYKDLRILTEGILPTIPEMSKYAFVILEGVALRRHDDWHRLWKAAEQGETTFEPQFINWFRESQYARNPTTGWQPSNETAALYSQVKEEYKVDLSIQQLYWYERKRADYIAAEGDDATFLTQYPTSPSEAFQNAGICAFSKRKLRQMYLQQCRSPIWRGEVRLDDANDRLPRLSSGQMGRLKIWEWPDEAARGNLKRLQARGATKDEIRAKLIPPDPQVIFYVGGDPSLGVPGGDPACWQVIAIPSSPFEPLRQVACWHGYAGTAQFARIGAALGYMYGTAEICPEANGIGQGVIAEFKTINYPSMYIWRREDKRSGYWSDFYGWSTTTQSKQRLIAKMSEGVDEDLIVIRDADTLDEAYDFVDEGGSTYYSISKDGHGDRWMACCLPGTKITTISGPKYIYEVSTEDQVLGHDGNWHDVTAVMSRLVDESIFSFSVCGIQSPLMVTGEHPVLIRKKKRYRRKFGRRVVMLEPAWTEAKTIEKYDCVLLPIPKSRTVTGLASDELYLLGWYLGDGHLNKGGQLNIKCGKTEMQCALRLREILTRLCSEHQSVWSVKRAKRGTATLRSKHRVTLKDHGNFISVTCTNKWIAQFILAHIGPAKQKRLPDEWQFCDDVLPFVMGFLEADGSQNKRRGAIEVGQKDQSVLEGIQRILLGHRIWSTLSPRGILNIAGCWVNVLLGKTSSNRFRLVVRVLERPYVRFDEVGVWVPIQKVRRYDYRGNVHNLEVANVHSYTAQSVAVHNCMFAFYCANQLRPFKERSALREALMEQKRDPNKDYVNSDYSPEYDKPDSKSTDYMML